MAGTRRTTKSRIELEVSQNEAKNRRQFKRIQQWARQTKDQMDGIARVAGRVARVTGTAILAIGGAALRAYGQMEKLQTSFVSMLKSGPKAVKLLAQLTKFAAKTPFQLLDIGAATKQLLAFGVTADKMMPTLETLGDIAAGAGVALSDMAQIYGKSMSKGKVQTEELNQMAERGIPIIATLVARFKEYGHEVSKPDIYKMAEKGLLTFEMLDDALQSLTTGSGIFADQMKLQSQTLLGLWSTVKDNIFNLLAEVGKQLEETFSVKQRMREFIAWLQGMLKWIQDNKVAVSNLARWLVRGFGYAISVLVTSKLIGWLALVVRALAKVRTGAGATALAARAMWASFTLGIAFVVPFIIENWEEVRLTFWLSIRAIKGWWEKLMDSMEKRTLSMSQRNIKAIDDMADRLGIKRPGAPGGGGASWGKPTGPVRLFISKKFGGPGTKQPGLDIPEPEAPGIVDPQGSWWDQVKAIWGSGAAEGEGGADLEEDDKRLREGVFTEDELDKIVDDYKAAQEKIAADAEAASEKKKELHDEQVTAYDEHLRREFLAHQAHLSRVAQAEDIGANSKIKGLRAIAKVKAQIDKATAIYELTLALAKDPAAAFAKTYAVWGWPLGAIFGAIAQVATYASLIAGIASIKGMAQGGRVSGGTPGRDSVLTSLTPGELVVPTGNFEEVVDGVAASRNQDLSGGETQELRVMLELDGQVVAERVTEIQKRNRAF